MSFHDLRGYIEFLDEQGELKVVDGADWELEIGGLTELMIKQRPSPALLFDNIVGHEPGYRLLSNATTTPLQFSAGMGYEPTKSKREAIVAHRDAKVTDLPPTTLVSSGPVLENVHKGDDIDITEFPAPRWHEDDGGQYIGTGCAVITNNAETGGINAGVYRVQVQGPDTVTVYISPGMDGNRNRKSYLDRGEPAPMVVSLGHALDIFYAATQQLPSTVNELEYAGGLRGESVDVIEGDVTGLPIPAHAELVFEGFIYPDSALVPEGPFGEFTGYYAGTGHEEIPMTVERVYFRNDPINLGWLPLPPPAQGMLDMRAAATLWKELKNAGMPGVQAVNSLPAGPRFFEIVSLSTQYAGHSKQVGVHAASGRGSGYHGRFTVVVDDDIDVFNQDEVFWALATRCDPATDIHIIDGCWSTTLDPTIPPERKEAGDLTNSRAVLDATRPYHWKDEFPKVSRARPELLADLREKWGGLFDGVDDPHRPVE
ncbi:UbiD family decarboxylase [Haladaptatus sp. DJG-WS-42]|uniref:UbiD family decarboxylase n=1 Tax=Haladaptatus sp. DJG-WS-42 TaxID=3120516 RepID=UPI0030D5839B